MISTRTYMERMIDKATVSLIKKGYVEFVNGDEIRITQAGIEYLKRKREGKE